MSDNIYRKLLSIQSELKAPKSQFNKFGNYNYRNCEDILEAVKPLCANHSAVVTVSDEIVLIGERYYIKAEACLNSINPDDKIGIVASAYAREPESQKGMAEPQCTGSASSYARKYALNGLFAIDDTKDADSGNHSKAEDPPKKKKVYKNFIFLTEMKTIKDILGDEKYYGLLKKHGYDHSNTIPPNNQESALKAFNSLVDSIEGKGT